MALTERIGNRSREQLRELKAVGRKLLGLSPRVAVLDRVQSQPDEHPTRDSARAQTMLQFPKIPILQAICCSLLMAASSPVMAAVVKFSASDFGLTPVFSNVQTFDFTIDIAGPILAGTTYSNPTLNGVTYSVSGTLAGTPSGFPAFSLVRSIGGAEFYSQGSSLSFSVSATANLSDGLQVAELTGTDPVFVFDGREVGTGRYHPALFQLNANGTGSIRNSNNFGGINPSSMMMVDVNYGEEYITNLSFNAGTLTLVDAAAVPEPSSLGLFSLAAMTALFRRRRARARSYEE